MSEETVSDVKSRTIEKLICLADIYCAATGQTRASLAKAIHGRGGQIDDLAAGLRDLTTRVAEDAFQWFSDHWPAETDWPDTIERPAARAAEAGSDFPDASRAGTGNPHGGASVPAPGEAAA